MIRSEKCDVLIKILGQSLTHCQRENMGKPFDIDAQSALSANDYGVMTEFTNELGQMILNVDKVHMREYVRSAYYKIAFYGVLFEELETDYERQMVLKHGPKYSALNVSVPHDRANAYATAIDSTLREMRNNAATYLNVDLTPLGELTIDNFTIDGEYFVNATPPAIAPPPPKDEPKAPTIYILPDAKSALIADLLPYVDHSQHEILQKLIENGIEPEQSVICNCEQAMLGKIFYDRVKANEKKDRKITTYKTKIAKWIYVHFARNESGSVKKLSESTILNYLSGKGFAN